VRDHRAHADRQPEQAVRELHHHRHQDAERRGEARAAPVPDAELEQGGHREQAQGCEKQDVDDRRIQHGGQLDGLDGDTEPVERVTHGSEHRLLPEERDPGLQRAGGRVPAREGQRRQAKVRFLVASRAHDEGEHHQRQRAAEGTRPYW
jgi:hypothetical protein